MSRVSYSSVVGSLMYAMVYTRHDLSYIVSVVRRYFLAISVKKTFTTRKVDFHDKYE